MSIVDLPLDGIDLPERSPHPAQLLGLVTGTISQVTEDRLVDIQVVTAQLVGNAYQHARAPRRLRLRRSPGRDLVRIEVDDGCPSLLPVLGRLDSPEDGRGMLMVNRLSVNWGCLPGDSHKTVWAEVRLD